MSIIVQSMEHSTKHESIKFKFKIFAQKHEDFLLEKGRLPTDPIEVRISICSSQTF